MVRILHFRKGAEFSVQRCVACCIVLAVIACTFSGMPAAAAAQSGHKEQRIRFQEDELNGPVKKVVIEGKQERAVSVFDEQGRTQYEEMTIALRNDYVRITNRYDGNVRLISQTQHQELQSSEIRDSVTSYTYDDKKGTFQVTDTENGKTTIVALGKLDSQGRISRKSEISLYRRIRVSLEYNQYGQISKRSTDDDYGSPIAMEQKIYTADGKLAVRLSYHTLKEGVLELFSKTVNQYENSRLMKTVTLDAAGKTIEVIRFEYEAEDSHHNWTKLKEITTCGDKTKTELVNRTIEYYN